MHVDVTLAFSQFIGSLPIFVTVLLARMHGNCRVTDVREGHPLPGGKIDLLTGKVAETRHTRGDARRRLKR